MSLRKNYHSFFVCSELGFPASLGIYHTMAYKPLSYKIDRIKVSFVEESLPGHVGQILEGFNSSELIVSEERPQWVLAEC